MRRPHWDQPRRPPRDGPPPSPLPALFPPGPGRLALSTAAGRAGESCPPALVAAGSFPPPGGAPSGAASSPETHLGGWAGLQTPSSLRAGSTPWLDRPRSPPAPQGRIPGAGRDAAACRLSAAGLGLRALQEEGPGRSYQGVRTAGGGVGGRGGQAGQPGWCVYRKASGRGRRRAEQEGWVGREEGKVLKSGPDPGPRGISGLLAGGSHMP